MTTIRRARRSPTSRARALAPEPVEAKVGVHYLRVSSVRQTHTASDVAGGGDGNSIATQREECDLKATEMAVPVAEVFVEPGKSAQTIEKRPEFRRLLAYLAEHPEVGYVFVYSRSRAFRNIEDAVLTRKHLRGLGVKIISTKEDFGDSLEAEFMETISDSMNDLQNKKSGQDIRLKMAHKAKNGGTIGRAPIGYLNVRKDIEGRQVNTVDLDPERAPLIRTVFELYATGDYTLEDLCDACEDMGLRARPSGQWKAIRPLSKNSVHRILGDPYYAGYTVYDGEQFDGRHTAIVPGDLFERVQDVLELRSSPAVHDHKLTHYLRGLLFCDRCEQAGRHSRLIYTEVKGNGGRYGYYKCRSKQTGLCSLPHLPVGLVERKIADFYSHVALTPDYLDQFQAALEVALAEQQTTERELAQHLAKEQRHLNEQEDRLLDLVLDGDLPKHKIQERLSDLRRKRDSLTARLSSVQADLTTGAELLNLSLSLARDPHALYSQADDDSRAHLNKAFFIALYLDDRADIEDTTWTEPFTNLREIHEAWLGFPANPLVTNESPPAGDVRTDTFRLEQAIRATRPLQRTEPAPNVQLGTGLNSHVLVGDKGVEPLTSSTSMRRSSQLS